MKIVVDSYIPYIQGVLDKYADVVYLPHKEITKDNVQDADALIIRTRTHCNKDLLEGSRVKFIASATIGYDHIDNEYCKQNNITWTNAPGCNALSVTQYMASAFSFLKQEKQFDLAGKTIGIIGVGAVGSKIEELAHSFNMRVLLNDPPRARKENNNKFVTLSQICREADIITFHTPLNTDGEDKTFHLGDSNFFNNVKKKPVIVNAARGEIIDTMALLEAIKNGKTSDIILDCWENEPDINRELLAHTTLATPHIAGYSADGKANAATYSVRAVSRFFSLGLDNWQADKLPEAYPLNIREIHDVEDFFLKSYDIRRDSVMLKESPAQFEEQRSNYPFRREPLAYTSLEESELGKKLKKQFPVFFQSF